MNNIIIYEISDFPWDNKYHKNSDHKYHKISDHKYHKNSDNKYHKYHKMIRLDNCDLQLDTYGTTEFVNKLVNFILKENISFPYKRFFIKESEKYEMIKRIDNLEISWNHEPYIIKDQMKSKIKFPITFSFGNDKPIPYVYLHTNKIYQKMDINK